MITASHIAKGNKIGFKMRGLAVPLLYPVRSFTPITYGRRFKSLNTRFIHNIACCNFFINPSWSLMEA